MKLSKIIGLPIVVGVSLAVISALGAQVVPAPSTDGDGVTGVIIKSSGNPGLQMKAVGASSAGVSGVATVNTNESQVLVYNYLVLIPFTNQPNYEVTISNIVQTIYNGGHYGVRPSSDIGWTLNPSYVWQPKGAQGDRSVYTNWSAWSFCDVVSRDIAYTFYPTNLSYGQTSTGGELNRSALFNDPNSWYSPADMGLLRQAGGGVIVAAGYMNTNPVNRLIMAANLKFFTSTNYQETASYINGYSRNFTTTATWLFDDGKSKPVRSSRTLYRNCTPLDVGYSLVPRLLTNNVSLSVSVVASTNNSYTLKYSYEPVTAPSWVDCLTVNGGDTFNFPANNPPGRKIALWRAFLQ